MEGRALSWPPQFPKGRALSCPWGGFRVGIREGSAVAPEGGGYGARPSTRAGMGFLV